MTTNPKCPIDGYEDVADVEEIARALGYTDGEVAIILTEPEHFGSGMTSDEVREHFGRCHFCMVGTPTVRASVRYGEPVCDQCAIVSHTSEYHDAIDGCRGEDAVPSDCPWQWTA